MFNFQPTMMIITAPMPTQTAIGQCAIQTIRSVNKARIGQSFMYLTISTQCCPNVVNEAAASFLKHGEATFWSLATAHSSRILQIVDFEEADAALAGAFMDDGGVRARGQRGDDGGLEIVCRV